MKTTARLMTLIGIVLANTVLLSGCATSNQSSQIYSSENTTAPIKDLNSRPQRPQPIPDTSSPMPTRPDAPIQSARNPAVGGLLHSAAQARSQGNFDRAQTLAERAQALEPHEAQSYLELARIYQTRGDKARARQMALRGLSVVNNDPNTQYELQLLSAP
jgi:tetratricopeptide (TPR) repeat protein